MFLRHVYEDRQQMIDEIARMHKDYEAQIEGITDSDRPVLERTSIFR